MRYILVIMCLTLASPAWAQSADEQFSIGNKAFLKGDGPEAMRLYREAGKKGHNKAQHALGQFYYRGLLGVTQDFARALKWFKKATANGNVRAEAALGQMYYNGEGVPRNYSEAARRYHNAIDGGYKFVHHILGNMYQHGLGVPKNYQTAITLYCETIDHPIAMNNLGLMYINGHGVPQNLLQAYKWFELAAARSFTKEVSKVGIENRDFVAARMKPDQIANARLHASKWTPDKPCP